MTMPSPVTGREMGQCEAPNFSEKSGRAATRPVHLQLPPSGASRRPGCAS
jgi:hypothetical protein